MFLMTKNEIIHEINKINNYLNKCLWMDFEFCMMNASKVVLSGSIDQSYNDYAIEIEFEEPHFISTLFIWQIDTSKFFIQLVSEKEFEDLNVKYRTIIGDYIFKINIEDFESTPIYIAAKKISCKILNKNPFSRN